jgi:hypothetical protein
MLKTVSTQLALASDTLPEVLAKGNTTGGTDLAVSAGDDITFADNSKAIFGDGSDLQIYSDGATGQVTGSVSVTGTISAAAGIFTTADINAGTVDNTVIGGTTAGAASFTTLGANDTSTLLGATITNSGGHNHVSLNGDVSFTGEAGISHGAAGLFVLSPTSTPVSLRIGNAQWLGASATGAANFSGDVSIGSTGGNLLLNTASVDPVIGGIEVTGAVNKYCGMFRNTTNGFGIIFRSPANSSVGSITWDGGTTYYSTSSDYRLKEDDVPMTGATERVKALRPINFAWKFDGSRTDGFFAHELAEVVPEAATGSKDAMRDEEYEVTPAVEEVRDEGGNVTTEAVAAVMGTRSVPNYQGIDQGKLVPLLTATIQELIARIEALESK